MKINMIALSIIICSTSSWASCSYEGYRWSDEQLSNMQKIIWFTSATGQVNIRDQLLSQAYIESSFNIDASSTSSHGLMQINVNTARVRLGLSEAPAEAIIDILKMNPYINIELAMEENKYWLGVRDTKFKALQSYNAGWNIDNFESRHYAVNVLKMELYFNEFMKNSGCIK